MATSMAMDLYGNSLLHVPERILADGSIQFPYLIGNKRIMTLMKVNRVEIVESEPYIPLPVEIDHRNQIVRRVYKPKGIFTLLLGHVPKTRRVEP